jgi:hypothetical protein
LYYVETHLGLDPLSATWFPVNCALIHWILECACLRVVMVLLFRLCARFGLSEKAALARTLAVALGAPFYPYATAFYAHNPTANLMLVAAYLILAPTVATRHDAAAGFLAGCAVLCEYAAAFAVAVFYTTLLDASPACVNRLCSWRTDSVGCLQLVSGRGVVPLSRPATTIKIHASSGKWER